MFTKSQELPASGGLESLRFAHLRGRTFIRPDGCPKKLIMRVRTAYAKLSQKGGEQEQKYSRFGGLLIGDRRRNSELMLVDKKYISVKFSHPKLKKRHNELAVLYDIGSYLTSSLGLKEILDRAILKVREYFRVDAVRIYLMDEANEWLQLAAYKGIPKKQVEALRSIHIREGFSGKAARTKSFIAQRVADLENGARAALLRNRGFKVIICVPLIVKDRVMGVMNLASKRMIPLSQQKIDLLVAIGNQIAVAVNVAGLYRDIQEKAKEVRQKKDDLEFFAYTVSHDLKNPAVGIAGFVRLLARKYDDRLDEKGRKYCDQIKKAAQQIERFTTDINDYIKFQKIPLNIQKANVKSVLKLIKEEMSPILTERNIAWSEPESMPYVMADQLAITRVFRNLIDNALKHAGDKLTEIAIGYDQNDQFHVFSVTNDGVTISELDSELIFQVFRRPAASGHVEGSGLGLAIVKEIAEAHGGKVWLESQLQEGTTFYVSLAKRLRQGSRRIRQDRTAATR